MVCVFPLSGSQAHGDQGTGAYAQSHSQGHDDVL